MSVVAVALEALVTPQRPPFALLMTAQPEGITIPEPLPSLMPSKRRSFPGLMAIQMRATKPLRFGFRSARDSGEGYESYGHDGGD